MRKGKKVLHILLSIVLILYLILTFGNFYGGWYGMEPFANWVSRMKETAAGFVFLSILAGILLLFGLYLLIRGIFAKTIVPFLKLDYDKGTVTVSETTIESVVRSCLKDHREIRRAEIKPKLYDSDEKYIEIDLENEILPGTPVDQLGKILQNQIKREVENFTGIPVRNVDLSFAEVEREEVN